MPRAGAELSFKPGDGVKWKTPLEGKPSRPRTETDPSQRKLNEDSKDETMLI